MKKIRVSDYVEGLKDFSNMPFDLSIALEPFELFVAPHDFEGLLLGVFLEDLLDQYGENEHIDVFVVLELIGFYANEHEINTIVHSLLISQKHGAAHSL